jgi:hypothetical protein
MNDRDPMNRYRFHWRDGTTNEGEGRDAADALNRLGFGRGAVAALDYYERVDGIVFGGNDKLSPPVRA